MARAAATPRRVRDLVSRLMRRWTRVNRSRLVGLLNGAETTALRGRPIRCVVCGRAAIASPLRRSWPLRSCACLALLSATVEARRVEFRSHGPAPGVLAPVIPSSASLRSRRAPRSEDGDRAAESSGRVDRDGTRRSDYWHAGTGESLGRPSSSRSADRRADCWRCTLGGMTRPHIAMIAHIAAWPVVMRSVASSVGLSAVVYRLDRAGRGDQRRGTSKTCVGNHC
jgi:hypothetical protein